MPLNKRFRDNRNYQRQGRGSKNQQRRLVLKRKLSQRNQGLINSSLRTIVKKKLEIARARLAKVWMKQKQEAKQQEIGRLFLLPNVIEGLSQYGSLEDLHKLRQMSQTYHKYLNPTYLDRANRTITFGPESVLVGRDRIVTKYNWDSQISHVFRTFKLYGSRRVGWGRHIDFIPLHADIYSQIRFYIRTLYIVSLSPTGAFNIELGKIPKGERISGLIGLFPQLKQIKISYGIGLFMDISFDELELGLRNISSDIKVEILVSSDHEEILTKFGTRSNFSFNFQLNDGLGYPLEVFQGITDNFGNMSNMEFNLALWNWSVNTRQKLETLVALSLKHKEQIKTLELHLNFLDPVDPFQDPDESEMRRYLSYLSPMLTSLYLEQEAVTNWDLLSGINDWANISKLKIVGYSHPLEILRHCPSLKRLCLHINTELCIFRYSQSQLSKKEQLMYYFGNLPRLKKLKIFGTGKEYTRTQREELKAYLKELLPSDARVSWYVR